MYKMSVCTLLCVFVSSEIDKLLTVHRDIQKNWKDSSVVRTDIGENNDYMKKNPISPLSNEPEKVVAEKRRASSISFEQDVQQLIPPQSSSMNNCKTFQPLIPPQLSLMNNYETNKSKKRQRSSSEPDVNKC